MIEHQKYESPQSPTPKPPDVKQTEVKKLILGILEPPYQDMLRIVELACRSSNISPLEYALISSDPTIGRYHPQAALAALLLMRPKLPNKLIATIMAHTYEQGARYFVSLGKNNPDQKIRLEEEAEKSRQMAEKLRKIGYQPPKLEPNPPTPTTQQP